MENFEHFEKNFRAFSREIAEIIFWQYFGNYVAKPGLRLVEQNREMITSRSDGQSRKRKGKWDARDLVKRAAAALHLICVVARVNNDTDPLQLVVFVFPMYVV